METRVKVCSVHLVTAIIAAAISFLISKGYIAILGTNQAIAGLAGIVILYLTGQLCDRIFKDEDFKGFKKWLSAGIVPFIFIWFVVWTILFNYM